MNQHYSVKNIIWRLFLTVLLVLFMLLSLNSVLPVKWRFPSWRLSPHLTQRIVETADGTRTDYVNAKGVITVALDQNFATIIRTLDQDGNCVFEQYFDNHGKPAIYTNGNSALRREYNSDGQWVRSTYLDADLNPVVIRAGYASAQRTYNKNKKLETETYYNADGLPTPDYNKRYGVRFEYDENGRETVVTSLDASGNPMFNRDHYAISKNTYTPDGELYMTMYYGPDGNPVKLGFGQSGYMYNNGKPICVDQDGRGMFVLRHFLHNSIFLVLLMGILLLYLILRSGRIINCILLLFYLAFIVYMTIIDRASGSGDLAWNLPLNYYFFFTNKSLLANIWLFIPFGAILYKLSHLWEIIAFPILLSLIIETAQIVLDIGAFDISDLIANSLGGIIGVIVCYLLEPLVKSLQKKS